MTANRTSLIITLSVIAAIAVLTISMATAPHPASSASAYDRLELVRSQRNVAAAAQQAYLDQRHGEWTAGHVFDAQQAYLDFRHGEQTAGVNAAQAYLDYRRGEWSGK